METRRWHAHYPPGMNKDLDIPHNETLVTVLQRSFQGDPDRVVAISGPEQLNYGQLDDYAAALSSYWVAQRLRAGDRVALMMPNHLAFPIALVAALRSGLIAVPVNPLYTTRELAHQITDAGASAVVTTDELYKQHRSTFEAAGVNVVLTVSATGFVDEIQKGVVNSSGQVAPLAEVIVEHLGSPLVDVAVQPDDPAVLQYTGGTTGPSKGAVLTHRSWVASCLQTLSWLRLAVRDDLFTVMMPLPLYHVYPLQTLLMTLQEGGHIRLVANARDSRAVIAEMKREHFAVLAGVNTLFNALVEDPALKEVDYSGTRVVIGAGASVQSSVSARWAAAGAPPITEAYGLTELSPAATFNPLGHNGLIGIPLPSTDVRIVDLDGQAVADGEAGELLIKGPQLFSGYWLREAESRAALTEDGFLKTGDVVVADEAGRMRIVDRKKDMILVSGFNVYPNEIEAVVAAHEGVFECACIGEPDSKTGEAPHLFVVRRRSDLSVDEIVAHCRNNLTPYKIPRRITFLDALPKSTVGKILRRELRSSS